MQDITDSFHDQNLEQAMRQRLKCYFALLESPTMCPTYSLYDLILREIEKPLIEETLLFCQQNQSRAAKILGLNRNTLRKKMSLYGL